MSGRWRRAGLLCCLFWLCAAPSVRAVVVTAEARVSAEGGDLRGAGQAAVQNALSQAVEEFIARHVPPGDREDRSAVLHRTFLRSPAPYVRRYSIALEHWEEGAAVVEVRAEIDHERVLQELRTRGIAVRTLPVLPRVLTVHADEEVSARAARAAEEVLEENGYAVLPYSVPLSEPTEGDEVARWARQVGYHFALVIGSPTREEREELEEPGGDTLDRDPGVAPRLGEAFGEASVRETVVLEGWLVDAATAETVGGIEAGADGYGADPTIAREQAARRTGVRMAQHALRLLVQSGWSPGQESRPVEVVVEGLADPLAVEQVHRALGEVAEIRGVALHEVRSDGVAWRLDIIDSGLERIAVLGTVRLPRGRLVWREGLSTEEEPQAVQVVEARWTPQ